MKYLFISVLAIAIALSWGCAANNNGVVLGAVGPAMQSPPKVSTNGTLVVYSAYEVTADFNARDPNRPEYSDYKIFTADGRLLQRVHNNSGTMLQDPMPVSLPRGEYRVVAMANGYGFVTVPVIIEPNQSTILHLEGGGNWSDESVFNQTNAVRLPDGQIVGWKASSSL